MSGALSIAVGVVILIWPGISLFALTILFTPFISWIRALDGGFDPEVDLYYSVGHHSDAVYLDEMTAASEAHPSLRVHVVDTSEEGLLDARAIVDGTPPASRPWVYTSGPPAMMHSLARSFRRFGIPHAHIRFEEFDVR